MLYTVRHKNTPKFFHHNLKKSDPIVISFGKNIPDANDCLVAHLTHWLFFALPGEKTNKILHFL